MLHGAEELAYWLFRGVVFDVDASELPPGLASYGLNVDLEGETVGKRLGKAKYNSSAVAAAIQGLTAYYPQGGAARTIVVLAGTAVYADANQDGDFVDGSETLDSGRTAGAVWADFIQWKNTLYVGDGVNALKKWIGSGALVSTAMISAPGSAPPVPGVSTVAEDFENTHASWTKSSGTGEFALSSTSSPAAPQGSYSLKLTVQGTAAYGVEAYKTWSQGANLDLSAATEIVLKVRGNYTGIGYQIAAGDNANAAIDWSRWPVFKTKRRNIWETIRVPLAGLPSNDRTASDRIYIRFVDSGNRTPNALGGEVILYFDDARVQGVAPAVVGEYQFYYTYAEYLNGVMIRESNPSPVARVSTVRKFTGTAFSVSVTASGDAAVTNIRIYMSRQNGVSRYPRLAHVATNTTATITIDKTESDLIQQDADELKLYVIRIDPPIAATYAAVNDRMLAAGTSATPWRIYVSKLNFPEEFSSTGDPNDVNSSGWIDLPTRDPIQRIIEYDGMGIVFCDRSIYSLEGGGFDDYVLMKRADVGLSARDAVTVLDRLVYFLASDGLRVLLPGSGDLEGDWQGWVVSEPVASKLRGIPAAYRKDAALGIDERGRLHLSYTPSGGTANTESVVFDPRIEGTLARDSNPSRSGWTWYQSWGFSSFCSLKRGQGDNGQMLGGDTTSGYVWYLHRNGSDTALETDDGSAIAWVWQGPAQLAPGGMKLEASHVSLLAAAAASQSITAAVRAQEDTDLGSGVIALGAPTTGSVERLRRFPASARGRQLKLRLSGSHSVAMRVSQAILGVYVR